MLTPEDRQRSTPGAKRTMLALVLALAVMGGVIAWLLWARKVDADRAEVARVALERAEAARIASIPRTREVLATAAIFHGQKTIGARSYEPVEFRVAPEMKDAHLVGNFIAAGNLNQAIDAVLISEADLLNFKNDHNPKTYYSTGGLKTTDQFDVVLGPGSYVLVFSNRDAILRTVYVTANVDLKYTRTETATAGN